jgi:hypothetical protein
MEKASLSVLVTLVLVVLLAAEAQAMSPAKTSQAVMDTVVKQEVQKAINRNPRVGAALVRLVFHDCWVRVSLFSSEPCMQLLRNLACWSSTLNSYSVQSHACKI